MSCVTIGGQEVSARSMLPPSKRRLIGGLFNKSKQSPRDHNRQLLQQNRHKADIRGTVAFVCFRGRSGQRTADYNNNNGGFSGILKVDF